MYEPPMDRSADRPGYLDVDARPDECSGLSARLERRPSGQFSGRHCEDRPADRLRRSRLGLEFRTRGVAQTEEAIIDGREQRQTVTGE